MNAAFPSFVLPALPAWQTALLLAPAVLTALAALAARHVDGRAGWGRAQAASVAAAVAALASLVMIAITGASANAMVRADAAGGVMALLVAFIGWVVVRYSQRYLGGQARQPQYLRWLMATLAAVSLVVVGNHLLLVALAWLAASFAVHRLLTFFAQRPAAVLAAHKKFIVARLADACMLGAAVLFALAFGTLRIDALAAAAVLSGPAGLPLAAHGAMLLVVAAALLKCAQLPFHGWLIQVMESPTPVSALLHAGVVNLGGFVLIRLADVLVLVPVAQVLLVAVALATAVLAALVMSTRISVKVMLAWSTCAQMGFMLVQIGLGLWPMALLHLVAHSLYKAHAFLGAGGAVRRAMVRSLSTPPAAARQQHPAPPSPDGAFWPSVHGLVAVTVAVAVAASVTLVHWPPAVWVMAGIVLLALTPLWRGTTLAVSAGAPSLTRAPADRALAWLQAVGVAVAYVALHAGVAQLSSAGQDARSAPGIELVLAMVVAAGFALLFLTQAALAAAPTGRFARGLYPWFYGGLFLDERFSRAAFALFPPPLPVRAESLLPVPVTTSPAALGPIPAVSRGAKLDTLQVHP